MVKVKGETLGCRLRDASSRWRFDKRACKGSIFALGRSIYYYIEKVTILGKICITFFSETGGESDTGDNQATDWSSTNEDQNIDDNDV
ncbi:hypothetical protein TNIN_321771 [Trichonephila inaurata madagascariensis]|uniref:Uncharacterized protein n=1 Tax=Trichonephila inaurata madagascariensis TaxID=2747483 RepID=A0A8X6XTR0_9ARAC|nr:hypothetical protein TNIN_321771 [Trichonephila inaurata madagascariensis]